MTPDREYEHDLKQRREGAIRTLMACKRMNQRERDALQTLIDSCPELMGRVDVAACLGVKGPNLHKWSVADMPAPVTHVSNGAIPIYNADRVREYADLRGSRHEGNKP